MRSLWTLRISWQNQIYFDLFISSIYQVDLWNNMNVKTVLTHFSLSVRTGIIFRRNPKNCENKTSHENWGLSTLGLEPRAWLYFLSSIPWATPPSPPLPTPLPPSPPLPIRKCSPRFEHEGSLEAISRPRWYRGRLMTWLACCLTALTLPPLSGLGLSSPIILIFTFETRLQTYTSILSTFLHSS